MIFRCKNVCKDAVEIAEQQKENESGTDGLLFCYKCIAESNISNSYHPVKFIRKTINNLIVKCPYSIYQQNENHIRYDKQPPIDSLQRERSTEGDAPQICCEWKGKLSSLSDHINNDCLFKPFNKCPFGCINHKKQITRAHFKENETQHIDILLSMVQSLTAQLSQCQNQVYNFSFCS